MCEGENIGRQTVFKHHGLMQGSASDGSQSSAPSSPESLHDLQQQLKSARQQLAEERRASSQTATLQSAHQPSVQDLQQQLQKAKQQLAEEQSTRSAVVLAPRSLPHEMMVSEQAVD